MPKLYCIVCGQPAVSFVQRAHVRNPATGARETIAVTMVTCQDDRCTLAWNTLALQTVVNMSYDPTLCAPYGIERACFDPLTGRRLE